MDITLQQLRMLREVATRKTIAAAAESMGYTPSAISQQLSTLEKSTGVAVLERVGRNVRLTDAGHERLDFELYGLGPHIQGDLVPLARHLAPRA